MSTGTHAIMFAKTDWTFNAANKWIKSHNYEPKCIHDYPHFWRFSMTQKSPTMIYRIKKETDDKGRLIEFVFEIPKNKARKARR